MFQAISALGRISNLLFPSRQGEALPEQPVGKSCKSYDWVNFPRKGRKFAALRKIAR